MLETLICLCPDGEHKWQRERKRGVKPKYCPDHRPAPGEARPETPASVDTEPSSKARLDAVDLVTSSASLPEEFRRKLSYAVESLSDPQWLMRREPEDVTMMQSTLDKLMAEYERAGWRAAA